MTYISGIRDRLINGLFHLRYLDFHPDEKIMRVVLEQVWKILDKQDK